MVKILKGHKMQSGWHEEPVIFKTKNESSVLNYCILNQEIFGGINAQGFGINACIWPTNQTCFT